MNLKLLQKYVEGDISDADAERVAEWLDGDEARVSEYLALHKLHDIAVVNGRGVGTEAEPAARRPRLRRVLTEVAKVAAVVVAVVAVERLVTMLNSPEEGPVALQTVHVPAGQRARVTLPDGSEVWVNAKSTLTYPVDFGKNGREVTLDGEALFEVEADAGRPFRVNTAGLDAVVTGTEFNVSAYGGSERVSVALLKGRVSLQKPEGGEALYTMSPGDCAEWSEGKLNVSPIRSYDYFRWSEGLLCFNNETVREIIRKLELYYDITIDVQRRELLDYRYTGKFRTKDGIEQVLRTIRLEHNFRFEKDTENNRITIK